ncbi:hypothetical protein KAU33_05595 [Candidatus Dependentiae bacterium]|nr:hypothetical protein [Candidatus Dependentiae bacterium]
MKIVKEYPEGVFVIGFTTHDGKQVEFFSQEEFESKVEDNGLKLGPTVIPYKFIESVLNDKKNSIILKLKPDFVVSKELKIYLSKDFHFYLSIQHGEEVDICKNINIKCSEGFIKENFGKVPDEDISICPVCEAKILTRDKDCSYYYCNICNSILDPNLEIISNGNIFKHCPECGYYGRIKKYKEVYCVFLILFHSLKQKTVFLCDSCASKLGWKMLFFNFLFFLGIPSSIAVLIKSKMGRDEKINNLNNGIKLCKKVDLEKAEEYYNDLFDKHYEHPGLLCNFGLGALKNGDLDKSERYFQRALIACPGYTPVTNNKVA